MSYNRIKKNSLHSKITVHSNNLSNAGLSRIQLWAKMLLYLPSLQTNSAIYEENIARSFQCLCYLLR